MTWALDVRSEPLKNISAAKAKDESLRRIDIYTGAVNVGLLLTANNGVDTGIERSAK